MGIINYIFQRKSFLMILTGCLIIQQNAMKSIAFRNLCKRLKCFFNIFIDRRRCFQKRTQYRSSTRPTVRTFIEFLVCLRTLIQTVKSPMSIVTMECSVADSATIDDWWYVQNYGNPKHPSQYRCYQRRSALRRGREWFKGVCQRPVGSYYRAKNGKSATFPIERYQEIA